MNNTQLLDLFEAHIYKLEKAIENKYEEGIFKYNDLQLKTFDLIDAERMDCDERSTLKALMIRGSICYDLIESQMANDFGDMRASIEEWM